MTFEIKIWQEGSRGPVRAGIWSGNLHTAVRRALTGYPCITKNGDIAVTGADWLKLKIGEVVTLQAKRI
jgi:hypothetical protein